MTSVHISVTPSCLLYDVIVSLELLMLLVAEHTFETCSAWTLCGCFRYAPVEVHICEATAASTDSGVLQAWLDLEKRCVVIEVSPTLPPDCTNSTRPNSLVELLSHVQISVEALRISVPIVTIRFIEILKRGENHCLALRTKTPPKVTKSVTDIEVHRERDRQFHTSVDPSNCEAFASPTAFLCLMFASENDFRATSGKLRDFKVKMRPETLLVSQRMEVSSQALMSHCLPSLDSSMRNLLSRAESQTGDDGFQIQYALECLLKHGLLRQCDVQELLEMLLDLFILGRIEKPSRCLEGLVVQFPSVDRCNHGSEAFQQVCVLAIHTHTPLQLVWGPISEGSK
jgi:hypothetical protein